MLIFQVITCSCLGGAQSVLAHLANTLCKKNKVVVIAGEGDGSFWDLLDKQIIKYPCPSLKRAISPYNDIKTITFFKRLYSEYQPDIIHLHSSKAGMLGRIAFPANKVVYTVHGFDSIRLAFRKLLPLERMMQTSCAAIVGVSNYDKKNLKKEKITKNVSVIYNGTPIPETDDSIKWDIPSQYKYKVLCIARLLPPKNASLFIETAKLLPDYAFIWIGNQKKVTHHPKNVFFLGNMPQAGHYNKLADIFILPSNYEGLPVVILEAMSYGKPIVASDVGGISEIVLNGINGYVVQNQAKNFAEKIEQVLNDPIRYKQFSEESLRIYNEELTLDKMAKAYMKVYEQISESQ